MFRDYIALRVITGNVLEMPPHSFSRSRDTRRCIMGLLIYLMRDYALLFLSRLYLECPWSTSFLTRFTDLRTLASYHATNAKFLARAICPAYNSCSAPSWKPKREDLAGKLQTIIYLRLLRERRFRYSISLRDPARVSPLRTIEYRYEVPPVFSLVSNPPQISADRPTHMGMFMTLFTSI